MKYAPIIYLMFMLISNTLYYLDYNVNISYILDFVFGNSIFNIFILYILSKRFKYCIWHRIIIGACFINLLIANIDAIIGIPISDLSLLMLYYIVASIFIIIAVYIHIKQIKRNNNECKTKITKNYTCGVSRED